MPAHLVYATTPVEFKAPILVGQLRDPRWAGVSGLASSYTNPGVWWIHNDGGAGISEAGKFYAIRTNGRLLQEITLAGVSALQRQGQGSVDVEDVATGPGPEAGTYIYLGDIGGNRYTPFGRSTVRVFRVHEPYVDAQAGYQPVQVVTSYATLTLSYPNDERYDAETLMVDTNGDIYVVTKDGTTGTSRVFYVPSLPLNQDTATMTQVATLQFGSGALAEGGLAATSGDISHKTNEAIIRTYNRIFLWQKLPDASWGETFTNTVPYILPLAPSRQYEAVAFTRKGVHIVDMNESIDGNAAIQYYARVVDGVDSVNGVDEE